MLASEQRQAQRVKVPEVPDRARVWNNQNQQCTEQVGQASRQYYHKEQGRQAAAVQKHKQA